MTPSHAPASLGRKRAAHLSRCVPAHQGVIPRQTGTGFNLLGKEYLPAKWIQACISLARSYSLASRCKPVPTCRGITPRRAGTSLCQLAGGNDVAPW
ncbi:hypothetical protein PCASD_17405 [Puccinia coronata f. sp. avenae]|uniref:Uncharacterized protein n=1 Tax=Puccinia coronata f. sp. avenae TaxID=200324 RepID=A0A2N5U1Z7_9BASI|nr:hypothetical protein PCASD_17405 [Puccinia coronata f. sp. avenae]